MHVCQMCRFCYHWAVANPTEENKTMSPSSVRLFNWFWSHDQDDIDSHHENMSSYLEINAPNL